MTWIFVYFYLQVVEVSAGFAGDDLVCQYSDQQEGGKPRLTNKHLCLPQVRKHQLDLQHFIITFLVFQDYNKFDL